MCLVGGFRETARFQNGRRIPREGGLHTAVAHWSSCSVALCSGDLCTVGGWEDGKVGVEWEGRGGKVEKWDEDKRLGVSTVRIVCAYVVWCVCVCVRVCMRSCVCVCVRVCEVRGSQSFLTIRTLGGSL